jgi:glycerol-3-phosphate acyltransferase PlsY
MSPEQQTALAVFLPLAYLVGSIPVGLLVARSRGIDIRAHGSGNIGATNVGRVLGRRLGIMVFAIDVLKGLLPALGFGLVAGVTHYERPWPLHLAHVGVATAAVAGHVFPVWLRFKGGKGVATGLGALLGTFPVLTMVAGGALVVWTVSLQVSRMVGISSVIAGVCMPPLVLASAAVFRATAGDGAERPYTWYLGLLWPHLVVTGLLACLVVYTHRANIARTIAGTEPRIDRPRPDSDPGVAR